MSGYALVTGGAGYIGSHTVRRLRKEGYSVVVLDDLSTGFSESVLDADLVVGDVGDGPLVSRLIKEHDIRTVLHFAASTIVPESVRDPLKYYGNNTCNTRTLLQACLEGGVERFVFSSTAAVYGTPPDGVASESSPTSPINPYGTSKLMSEWMLRDAAAASDLEFVILRYFNVAGSDPEGLIGQSTREATLLIKVACEVAVGKRTHLSLFGVDYPTPDGTCIRDYIHVEDLATAHVAALRYLERGGGSTTLNCGYGHGHSVLEVIDSVQRAAGVTLAVRETARREGDPPSLVARADRIREALGWVPQHDDLDFIVRTSLRWERMLADRNVAAGTEGSLLSAAR